MRVNAENKKREKEAKEELIERFLAGKKMSIRQIAEEFYPTKDRLTYILAMERVERWMMSFKRYFKKQGQWFGNVDEMHNYGLPDSTGEYRKVMTTYYQLTKGIVANATMASVEATNKGLLDMGSETIRLPRLSIAK
jgi:hypothetical protein